MRRALVCVALILSACSGKPIFIADQVRFRVQFAEETVQIAFDLKPEYELKASNEIEYDILGSLIITAATPETPTVIASKISANPQTLALPWPSLEMNRLPNGSRLPASVRKGPLLHWQKNDGPISISLMYQASPDLVTGGAILSDQFKDVPKNFVATQKFKAPNGDVIATISLLGPTKTSKGGILFLGNFGINPFEAEQDLFAAEPAQIISKGDTPLWLISDLTKLLDNLSSQIFEFHAP